MSRRQKASAAHPGSLQAGWGQSQLPATGVPTLGQGGSQLPSSRGPHHGKGSVPAPLWPEEFYCFQELAAWSQMQRGRRGAKQGDRGRS